MANSLLSTKAAGSIIKINEGGSPVEFIVCKHDYESELNGSGRTLVVRKDCYDTRAFSGSNNAFSGSSMDTWLNNTWLKLLDADIQAAVGTTKFYCIVGNGSSTKQTLTRAVFLLSATELGKGSYNDGTALASAVCSQLAIAYRNGSAVTQWTRTPYTDNTNYVYCLVTTGNLNLYSYYNSLGSRPAFTLPSTTLVDDSGNIVTVDLTAHKTLINGTAYTVKGGKCMVNGTVYNILKGRTLIDGTAWDIALPEPPLVMPVKGDLITMNLDGTDRLYRVLKVVDGTTVEVLGMQDLSTSQVFNKLYSNVYSKGDLDIYLNTTWYSTLSTTAKNAIVAKNINQYQYSYSSSAYSGTTHSSYADYSTKALKANVGERYVYALDVEDIEMYFGGTGGSASANSAGTFSTADIWAMYWNTTSQPSSGNPWLCSADADSSTEVWRIQSNVSVTRRSSYFSNVARAALQIDLSKIDFTIN